jgi:hypothetical protein
MRHLSLSLIVGALLLTSCDMNKPKVQRTSSTQESVNVTPASNESIFRKTDTTTVLEPQVRDEALSDGAIVEEDILIQAEEEPITPRIDERKTYNEKQFSDDETDYPVQKNDRGETYDETQRSE